MLKLEKGTAGLVKLKSTTGVQGKLINLYLRLVSVIGRDIFMLHALGKHMGPKKGP